MVGSGAFINPPAIAGAPASAQQEKPNILIIMAD